MHVLGFSGIANGDFYRQRFGLRFVGHDSAAALVSATGIQFAAEEERFSRQKHTAALPVNAIAAALRHAGISMRDVDCLAYTWHASVRRIAHMFRYHAWRVPLRHWFELATAGGLVIRDLMRPQRARRGLAKALAMKLPPCVGVSHHLGHSACAYYTSPFEHAAALTVDGQGEDESASLGEWRGTTYRHIQSIYSPDSIGILYGMVTDFLSMRAAWDEYKVMAMAATGDANRFAPAFEKLVRLRTRGRFRTHKTAMVFKPGYCDQMLSRVLGMPKRRPDEPLAQVHFDLAAALQAATERVVMHMLHELRARSTSPNLCMAGGVMLNSVNNGKIRQSGLFENIHIPPVPGDHGGALGAALHVHHHRSGASRIVRPFDAFLGDGFSDDQIARALARHGETVHATKPNSIIDETAKLLAAGKIIGWFQGRAEYGPRALGHRSILAAPFPAAMRDEINDRIKHREQFRPFAAAVPAECAGEWFVMEGESPFMQFVLPVRDAMADRIPAVVHHHTTRVQTVRRETDPRFHSLLRAFERLTGVPLLLNTSLNDRDEPMAYSPDDALRTFARTDLDALIMDDVYLTRR